MLKIVLLVLINIFFLGFIFFVIRRLKVIYNTIRNFIRSSEFEKEEGRLRYIVIIIILGGIVTTNLFIIFFF